MPYGTGSSPDGMIEMVAMPAMLGQGARTGKKDTWRGAPHTHEFHSAIKVNIVWGLEALTKKKLVPYITKKLRVSYQFSTLQPCTRMASIVVVSSIVYHEKKKKEFDQTLPKV